MPLNQWGWFIFLAKELQQEKAQTCGFFSDPLAEVAL